MLPAQIKVREIEQRREQMTLTPILKTDEPRGEVPMEEPVEKPKRANKYHRNN
jgi:hypothetical protein